jgi:hypothetical protein
MTQSDSFMVHFFLLFFPLFTIGSALNAPSPN